MKIKILQNIILKQKNNTKISVWVKSGFSLVELLVSISVFLIFVIALNNTTGSINKSTRNSFNRERATVLAEEALEATRNIRDSSSNFANLPDGTYGLSTSGNIFNLSGSQDVTDIFTRVINISTISSNQKKITSTVTWADQTSPSNTVSLKTYLTNWRAPLNIGLTVDKVVTGGTKVASDFLPTILSTTEIDNTQDPPALVNVDIPIEFSPTTMTLASGTYTFLTSNDPDYTVSLSTSCTGNTITLANGDAKICTITYTANSIPCIGTPWGTMQDGTSNTAYLSSAPAGPCTSETRTCTAGVLSGSYTATTCAPGCTGTPWGNVVSGYSNTAYLASSVLYPSTCTSETRTCTLGTLSGSYTNTSCSVVPVLPLVTTTSPVTSITQTTAVGGGNTTLDGGATVTVSGLVWDTNINPTTALSTKTTDGWALGGPWTSNMTGLSCGTLYYVRAYATNSVGTAYGSNVTFTTSACNVVPTVTTPTATVITATSANLGATVSSLGIPATLTARGICYNTVGGPTLTNGATCVTATLAQTLTAYTANITGLIPGTLYYYRGYATNATGTGYSVDGSFTTLGGQCVVTGITPTTYDNSGSTSAVVNKPTGVLQNDIMFAYVLHNNASDRLNSIPSGWSEIGRHRNGSSNQALFYKVAGVSEPVTYTFGLSASSRFAVTINAYRGCFNTTTPIETYTNAEYVVNNTTYRAASLTLPSAYTTIIIFPSVNASGSKTFAAPITQGGGWTENYTNGNASSQFSRSAFSKMMTVSGATGVIDSIGFSASNGKHAFGVALKPL